MKRTYLQPLAEVLDISTDSMIAVSGNFTEGETITETIHDGTIDGGDAWSRHTHHDLWENDEDSTFAN